MRGKKKETVLAVEAPAETPVEVKAEAPAEVQAEAPAEAQTEAPAEAPKAKRKPRAKKAAAEPKKAEAAAEPKKRGGRKPMTEEEKAAAAKKRAEDLAKAENLKPALVLQFQGQDVDTAALLEAAKAQFKAEHKRTLITEMTLYIKPEDHAAYYVINGDSSGKVDF